MAIWTTCLRLLAFWSLAIWIGGFTFYCAVVIPVLHDQLGSALETGLVTQHVTDLLNLLSLVTIVLGWIRTALEQPRGDRGRTGWRGAVLSLAIITLCLVALVFLHRRLDGRLLSGTMAGFYPLHRAYLWISTLQWLASVVLLSLWAGPGSRSWFESRGENPQVSSRSHVA